MRSVFVFILCSIFLLKLIDLLDDTPKPPTEEEPAVSELSSSSIIGEILINTYRGCNNFLNNIYIMCEKSWDPELMITFKSSTLCTEIHTFLFFSRSILLIPTKCGRDITRGKGHIVREYDLN